MKLSVLFLLFIIYSIIGWIIEVLNFLITDKKFVDRGFLIGPYCPIYGCGAVLMTLCLKRYVNDPAVLFLVAVFICSVLEYFTSLFMELIFKTRWWDYSNKKFNINGRICLETMIPFGLLGCLMMYVLNPFLLKILNLIPNNILNILSIFIAIIFIVDNVISFKIIFNLKNITKNVRKDCTEEISKKVKQVLKSKNRLHKRLANAFPKMQPKFIKEKNEKIK